MEKKFSLSRFTKLIAALLSVLVIGVLVARLYIRSAPTRTDKIVDFNRRDVTIMKQHLKQMADKPNVHYGELLVRLASMGEADAEIMAQAKMNHADPLVREGCARALAFYDNPKSNELLKAALTDKERAVRVSAIQALAFHAKADRLSILEGYSKKENITEAEQLSLQMAFIRTAANIETRKQHIEKLFSLIHSLKDKAAVEAGVLALIEVAPQDNRSLEYVRGILKKNLAGPVGTAFAMRYLATQHDAWMKSNLASFVDTGDREQRLAALKVVHVVCPADRWTLIEKTVHKEKDAQLLGAALQAAIYMQGPEAEKLLEKIIQNKWVEGVKSVDVPGILKQIKRRDKVDPCGGA